MYRIDVPSATPDHMFTDGSPAGGVPATTVPADWLNEIQEELMSILTAAGVTPVKGDRDQVLTALGKALGTLPEFAWSDGENGYEKSPSGAIRQFGQTNIPGGAGGVIITMPIPFQVAGRSMQFLWRQSGQNPTNVTFMGQWISTTQFQVWASAASGTFGVYWEAVGR